VADQCHGPAGGDVELDVLEHRAAGEVFEGHALEPDGAGAGRQLEGLRTVRDLLGLVHHLEDPLARRGRTLGLADPHTERPKGLNEHPEVEVEGDERAHRQTPALDHLCAPEQHARLGEHRHEGDQRHVERALAVRLQRLSEDGLGARAELVLLGRLLRERLDDVNADDVLLGDGRDVGELLLDIAQRRVRDVAVAVGEHDQERNDRERDQRQLPVDEEEDCRHREDDEHILEEEDQAVAEEEAYALEIDGRARHQLAGLVAVVETERKTDEPGVETVAHIHLDAERLASGDQAAPDHQRCLQETEGDDCPDEDPECVGIARLDRLVHDPPRDPDEPDLRGLRADGEQDRDDERDPVRLQEPEQPGERAAVWSGLGGHHSSLAPALCATAWRARARSPPRGSRGSPGY
jgi:hypothetical protein